ncbi:MAG: MoaD/ThiS family protein [Bacteroidota bacterium]
MQISVIAYGIAKDILGQRRLTFEFEGDSIGQLKTALIEQYPDFAKLQSLSFAVEEEYQQDDYPLSDQLEVVIIPPVSGG